MSPVLFFDSGCPAPYSLRTLEQAALGGTEATVVRIAEALDADVMQHNRTEPEGHYFPGALPSGAAPRRSVRTPAGEAPQPREQRVDHLIILRDPRVIQPLCARFPGARPYLWLHDLVRPGSKRGRRLAAAADTLARLGVTLVCVSDFQRAQAQAVLERAGVAQRVRAVTIYNPIDERLAAGGAAVDREKLIFLSSPNKGLPFALDAFQAVRHALPGMRLSIGSPGYKSLRRAGLDGPAAARSGIEWLGPMPHARALGEVASALCVFYPNFVLPETFGLVFAEASAVGTPVLTHDCGAAAEVLADPRQLLPVAPAARRYERTARLVPGALRPLLAARAERRGVFEPYVQRIRAWRTDRPRTVPDPRFGLAAVLERWRALLNAA
ncbi:MAG: glycosyltransferase family 4 protein [Steroidobacteraceae bacterium]